MRYASRGQKRGIFRTSPKDRFFLWVTAINISAEEYEEFRRFLEDASGIVLGDNKHYLVTSRLNRLVREFDIPTFSELMRRLRAERHSSLRERIVDAMTTNETLWFRDNYPFEVLKQHILPELAQQRATQLRIWSAACSTGQEPYSISMALQEFSMSRPGALPSNAQIVGTDISGRVLKEAKAGIYDRMSVVRGLSEERKQRFFLERDERWEVRPEIRARVTFRELNLLDSYAMLGRFDIVFCRNVLIYFSADLKKDILVRIARSLNPRGWLFLGGSESPSSYSNVFDMVRTPNGVVYRLKEGARP